MFWAVYLLMGEIVSLFKGFCYGKTFNYNYLRWREKRKSWF